MTTVDTDDELVALLRIRAEDPLSRVDTPIAPVIPLNLCATPEMLTFTELALGFALHPFLKRIYSEVANGGFGPGYGLLALADTYRDGHRLPWTYHEFRKTGWPDRILPLWDWGDAIWSCIDGSSTEGAIITHDTSGSTCTHFTIRSWLTAWANGVDMWREIYDDQEKTIINPFTRKPIATKVRGRAKGVRRI